MISDTISLTHPSHYGIYNIAKRSHRSVTDPAQRDLGSEAGVRLTRGSVGVA